MKPEALEYCTAIAVQGRNNLSQAAARLRGDRVAILQLLRRLHQTYHKDEKLREVERLLKASGGS